MVTKNIEKARKRFDIEFLLLNLQIIKDDVLSCLFERTQYKYLNSIFGEGIEKVMVLDNFIIGRAENIRVYLRNEIECLPERIDFGKDEFDNNLYEEELENKIYCQKCENLITKLANFEPSEPVVVLNEFKKEFLIASENKTVELLNELKNNILNDRLQENFNKLEMSEFQEEIASKLEMDFTKEIAGLKAEVSNIISEKSKYLAISADEKIILAELNTKGLESTKDIECYYVIIANYTDQDLEDCTYIVFDQSEDAQNCYNYFINKIKKTEKENRRNQEELEV